MRTYRYLHLRRLHRTTVRGQPARGVSGTAGTLDRGDADDHARDELLRVHVHLSGGSAGDRTSGCASSRRARSCRWRDIRRSDRRTRSSTNASSHRGQTEFVFGLGIGPTPVSLEWRDSTLDFVVDDTAAAVVPRTRQGPRRLCGRSGFRRRTSPRDLPIEVISCGVPFLIAPIASRDAVDRVTIERRAYTRPVSGVRSR